MLRHQAIQKSQSGTNLGLMGLPNFIASQSSGRNDLQECLLIEA